MRPGFDRSLLLRAGLFTASLVSIGVSVGAQEKAGDQAVPFMGSQSSSVPIQVSPYHGLEPKLALVYSSEGRNGFVGTGWSLAGFSTVSRQTLGRGTPEDDNDDIYLLDGQELVPCVSGMVSPSCSTGGTHATKIESYVRIRFDATPDSWNVTGKDGTQTTLSRLVSGSPGVPGTPKWGVSSVVDTNGNTVSYAWTCIAGEDCYPSSVSYNGTTVTFFRETRADPISFADTNQLGDTKYRLKSVVVKVGSSPARAYKLTYGQSPVTLRSLLTSVQMYGKDVVYDSTTGAITAGTTLPAQVFGYSNDPLGKTFQSSGFGSAPSPTTEAVTWIDKNNVTAAGSTLTKTGGTNTVWDAGAASNRALWSGDGYVEVIASQNAKIRMVGLSNGNADVSMTDIDFAFQLASGGNLKIFEKGLQVGPTNLTRAVGDVLRVEVVSNVVRYLKNGVLVHTSAQAPVYPLLVDAALRDTDAEISNATLSGALQYVGTWCAQQFGIGDFNGDGRTDQYCKTGTTIQVALATATGLGQPTPWTSTAPAGNMFMADLNVDGRTDSVTYTGADGVFKVAVAQESGSFAAPTVWGTATLCTNGQPGTGDFNGDGRTDVTCEDQDGNVYVGVNTNGTSLNFSQWVPFHCGFSYAFSATMDLNGDGRTDWVCLDPVEDAIFVHKAKGNRFTAGASASLDANSCTNADRIFGDFNADGKTDVACRTNTRIQFSKGNGFREKGTDLTASCSGTAQLFAADIDGDGASEIICNKNGTPANDIEVRKWNGTALTSPETWKGSWCGAQVTVGDFGGDGKADLYCGSTAAIGTAGTGGTRSDLMTSIANGIGGLTQVTYGVSSAYTNVGNPPVKDVVTSVTTNDGRGNAATTTHTYYEGRYDPIERRFLGFRYVKQTLPCVAGESACPYVETWMRHDLASVGRPERVERRDGSGLVMAGQEFEYSTNGDTVPRTSILAKEWTYSYDGDGAECASHPCSSFGKRTLQAVPAGGYDSYGNVTRRDSSGDYDVVGDETIATWSYRPNTTAYIVDRVAEQTLYASTIGNPIKRQTFLYDGQQSVDVPPIRGMVTASRDWLDVPDNRWLTTSTTYDAYGNLTMTTDPSGRWIATAFDTTHHVYPTTVTNGVSESESTTWDPVCGVPAQRTDLAGQLWTTQTDALCRKTNATGPLGAFTTRSYLDFGTAGAQHIRVETPSASPDDGSGNGYTLEYFDGLDRTFRIITRGPSLGEAIVVDTTYDARGQVAARTAPYYSSESPQVTTFSYDALGRSRLTRYPDTNVSEQKYGLWTTDVRDEHAHMTHTTFDAYGRAILREQFINGQTLQTQSTYDWLGRLAEVSDPAGNTWSWTYDWLGRNTARTSPDSGTWSFEYDDAGRMTAQLDAKTPPQRTDFTYDLAGRLITKTDAEGTVTITRSEQRSGFYNTGDVTTVSSPGSILRTDYDALGRAVRQVRTLDGIDYVLERRYDAGGRLRGTTYPDGEAIGTTTAPITYDSSGRLKGIPAITSEIHYDAAGRARERTNANGTSTATTYSAERGFLTHVTTSGPTTIQDLGYSLDEAGLIEHVTSPFSNEGWTYTYDDLHRLTVAASASDATQSQTFEYDSTGNMTFNSRIGTYTYPAPGMPRPHAPTSVATGTMTYDDDGNLTAGQGRSIQWRADNLPRQINTTQFSYDGLGARTKKASPSSSTIYPVGDAYEVTNGVISKYIYAGNLGVIAKRVGTEMFWLHTDGLGSIQAITNAAGTEIKRRAYRPYGDVIADSSGHVEALGYASERRDEDTGLGPLNGRYYDPTLGLFISPFSSYLTRSDLQLNPYAHAGGNPVSGATREPNCARGPDGLIWSIGCAGTRAQSILGVSAPGESSEDSVGVDRDTLDIQTVRAGERQPGIPQGMKVRGTSTTSTVQGASKLEAERSATSRTPFADGALKDLLSLVALHTQSPMAAQNSESAQIVAVVSVVAVAAALVTVGIVLNYAVVVNAAVLTSVVAAVNIWTSVYLTSAIIENGPRYDPGASPLGMEEDPIIQNDLTYEQFIDSIAQEFVARPR